MEITRKQIIDDRELLKILQEKSKLQKEVDTRVDKFKNLTVKADSLKTQIEKLQEEFRIEHNKIKDEVQKIDEELKPFLTKIQRYKDKIDPIIKKHNIKVGEFEALSETFIENGKVVVNIIDLIENYKQHLRKQINDQRANKANPKEKKK
jgi:predicted  nucleic acid-binding Zn-ribbon protein